MAENIYLKVHELLSSGQKLVFVRTIRRSGSTPRNVGSMCIITEDGQLLGTVGGGALEFQVQKKAIELFQTKTSFVQRFQLNSENLAEKGMICGGDVDLYMEPLLPSNSSAVSLFRTINQSIVDNQAGVLVTRIGDDINAMDDGVRVFIQEDGKIFGVIPGLDLQKIKLGAGVPYDLIGFEDYRSGLFVEKLILPPRIFLFGAGHQRVLPSIDLGHQSAAAASHLLRLHL